MITYLTNFDQLQQDVAAFNAKKSEITQALAGSTGIISSVSDKTKEPIFYMLLFCLCVSQSKAIRVQEAIDELEALGFYGQPFSKRKIENILHGKARFHKNKADYLFCARKSFFDFLWPYLKEAYAQFIPDRSIETLKEFRKWLVANVNGFGYKSSSHFLRNIGMPGLAILDVHILHGMKQRKLLPDGKISLTTRSYSDIEDRLMDYAKAMDVSMEELDLFLWSERTGYVFK